MTAHLFLLAILALSSRIVNAVLDREVAVKPSINNTLEYAVETECKTCPYSLCTNKEFYTYETEVTLTCWTSGTDIGNDTYVLRCYCGTTSEHQESTNEIWHIALG